jgi:hypothetical protein
MVFPSLEKKISLPEVPEQVHQNEIHDDKRKRKGKKGDKVAISTTLTTSPDAATLSKSNVKVPAVSRATEFFHEVSEWIKLESRTTPCYKLGAGDLRANLMQGLTRLPSDLQNVSHPFLSNSSDTDSDDDAPPIDHSDMTIFDLIQPESKLYFTAKTEKLIELLHKDEEIHIIDPEELSRPSQVDQEREIVESDIRRFQEAYGKEMEKELDLIWKNVNQFITSIIELETQMSNAILTLDVSGNFDLNFDEVWNKVLEISKKKKKETMLNVIEEISKELMYFFDTLHSRWIQFMSVQISETCTNLNRLVLEVENQLKDTHGKILSSNSFKTSGLTAEQVLSKFRDTLKVNLESVVSFATQNKENVISEIQKVQNQVAECFSDQSLASATSKLDKLSRGDIKKNVKRLNFVTTSAVKDLVKAVLDAFPSLEYFEAIRAISGILMSEGEIKEALCVAKINKKYQKRFMEVTEREKLVADLYDDGIGAGMRCLDLSLRNVFLDEMAQIAASERVRELGDEWLEDPKDSKLASKKSKKKNPKSKIIASTKPHLTAENASTLSQVQSSISLPGESSAKKNKKQEPKSQDVIQKSTSIDGVCRVIPKNVLDIMPSPRRAHSNSSSISTSAELVPAVAQTKQDSGDASNDHTPTNGRAAMTSAEKPSESKVPSAHGHSEISEPIPVQKLSDAVECSPIASPSIEELKANLERFSLENEHLRAALTAMHANFSRVDNAARHMMAEHARLSQQHSQEKGQWIEEQRLLRERIAVLQAEVNLLKTQQIHRASPEGTSPPAVRAVTRPGSARNEVWTPTSFSRQNKWSGYSRVIGDHRNAPSHTDPTLDAAHTTNSMTQQHRTIRCLNCFGRGHSSSNCVEPCQICKLPGHSSDACPTANS